MLDWAGRHGWTMATIGDSCDWHLVQEMIVVLRDPLSRWISGIAQYLNTYILSVVGPNGSVYNIADATPYDRQLTAEEWIEQYNQSTERVIFDLISRFDDHTWPQCELFENLLPTVNRKYFYLDNNFNNAIAAYLNFKPYVDLDLNQKDANQDIQKLQEFFRHRLNTRPELKQRLRKAYARDYEIIKQVFNQ
jgi:uncharacterized protein YlaN (UPF0358 family)